MAEPTPNMPAGGLPPKPGEAAKVQPKKETVRISLPPKPSATIKLPSLPAAGSPPPAPPAPSAAAAPPPPAAAAPPSTGTASVLGRGPLAPPAPSAPRTGLQNQPTNKGTPAPGTAAAAAAAGKKPKAPKTPGTVSGLDVGLAIAAAVIGLAAVGGLFLLLQMN